MGYTETDADFVKDYGYKLVAGRLPEKKTEVALPLHLYNFFKRYGYGNDDNAVKINSYDELIGKEISLTSYYFNMPKLTVTGIIDTNFVYDKPAQVLFGSTQVYDSVVDFELDMDAVEMDMIHNTIFMCNGYNDYFIENIKSSRADEYVLRVLAPYNGSDAQKLKNIRVYTTTYNGQPAGTDELGVCYHLVNYCGKRIWDAEDTFSRIQDYAAYVVAATIVISVLFMFYYASGTVNDKRREIGILRALGASRLDIGKIFACEHGTFVVGTVAISSAIGAVLTVLLNNSFTKVYGIGTSFISFGIRQIAVIAAVALLAIVVGVAAPLIKLLIKKPVDVIADRK